MQLKFETIAGWVYTKHNDVNCAYYSKGDITDVLAAFSVLKSKTAHASIISTLNALKHFHAGVVETSDYVVAWVDHIRSVPVFYSDMAVSNAIDVLDGDTQQDAVYELMACGYVVGNETLKEGVKQLKAGEYLFYDKKTNTLNVTRYYTYLPDAYDGRAEDELQTALGKIIDTAFDRLIIYANGRKIWVPLSGGLDSRLVLGKLVEKGCHNIEAFSYGPAGNGEMHIAKKIAKDLGVKWRFLPSRIHYMRTFFNSQERKDYWRYASAGHAVPAMADVLAIRTLIKSGDLKPNEHLVVNGQSGDFITGGHISASFLQEHSWDDMWQAMVKKHYSLWPELLTSDVETRLRKRTETVMQLPLDDMTQEKAAAAYEQWEYEERQVKCVINAQRIYDFYEIDWWLPLWDKDLVEFYRTMPIEKKLGQSLYITYLKAWNFNGIFNSVKREVWGWPGYTKVIILIQKLVQLTLGDARRQKFVKAMQYVGLYGYQFAAFPYKHFLKYAQRLRNPVSLFALHYAKEQKLLNRIEWKDED